MFPLSNGDENHVILYALVSPSQPKQQLIAPSFPAVRGAVPGGGVRQCVGDHPHSASARQHQLRQHHDLRAVPVLCGPGIRGPIAHGHHGSGRRFL